MGAMFQDKCVGCHPASRTCEVLDKQGDYWRATVDRMVKQWGALLSPDQAGDMAQWLANQKSGSEPVCP
jgi:nitrate reductase beta subunit